MKKNKLGFTLLELLVAIFIFAIISTMAYRTIAALVITKQVVTDSQQKWGDIGNAVNKMAVIWDRAIPLAVRDENGNLIPAVLGKNKLSGNFDSQVEFTIAGFIGDPQYGSSAPKRVGFRYLDGNLYFVIWPYMNRVLGNTPVVTLILSNIQTFQVLFYYPDKQWRDTWPLDNSNFSNLPTGFKMNIKLNSGEEINRVWAL
ncbi:MAG: type secretion system protein GspJ [Pseudomonadota bacterium]|jgi:general secretion pathway protein J|nr:type II secretion system minor pseudopilin GspJ [Burkholderiales bacterium]